MIYLQVLHSASPFIVAGIKDNKTELLDPAIKGTTGILESIVKYNPGVKRVVITSSFASIVDPMKGVWPEKTYSEVRFPHPNKHNNNKKKNL